MDLYIETHNIASFLHRKLNNTYIEVTFYTLGFAV